MANFKQLLTQSWLVQKHSALEMHKVSPIGSGLLWGAAGSATFATVAAFNAARKNKNSPHSGDGWATAAKWSGGIALASKIGSVAAFSKAGLSGGFKGFSQRVEKRANEEYNGLLTKNKPGLQAPV